MLISERFTTALKSLDDKRDFRRAWDNMREDVKISAEDSLSYKITA
jgi:hypothetical protein